MKSYKKFLVFSLLVLCFFSLVRCFDNLDSPVVDIVSHFPVQYAFLAFIIMVICLYKRIIPLAALAGFLFLLNSSSLVDIGQSVQAAGRAGDTFKVFSANINFSNEDLSGLKDEIQKIDPEIVLLMEVTPAHVEQIRSVIKTYPYSIEKTPIGDLGITGLVFLCKYPILNYHVTKLSEAGNAILEATLKINQQQVVYYGTHAQRAAKGNFNERKNQFHKLTRRIIEQSLPVIVAGDLNSTPFSPLFRELIKVAGLKDSTEGFGWQPSWPAYFPLLWIPIDHVLVSSDIQVHSRSTGSFIGSDHFPVFAELSINPKD